MSLKVRITVRAPRGKKGKWSLVLDKITNNLRTQETISNDTLDSINKKYIDKSIDINTAKKLIEDLKLELLNQNNQLENIITSKFILEDNLKIFNILWSRDYVNRDIEETSLYSAKRQFISILELFGTLSLRTCNLSTVRTKINASTYARETLRHFNHKINALLKEAGNSIKLSKQAKLHKDISHLTSEEFEIVVSSIDDLIIKDLVTIAFYTGMRTGELWGLESAAVDKRRNTIKITQQYTRAKIIKNPKQNKNRVIIYPKTIQASLDRWIDLTSEQRDVYRFSASRILKATSKLKFPKNKLKHVSMHDLRRSFVIYNLQEIGMNLSEVAFLIGDTLAVLQANYAGYSYQEDGLDNLRKKYGLS